ncbi:MAG: DUF624 domain-containing protein [Acetatifactor sp.]|nr:DUF624 domain-containing protein [Acetatifactor sp.]
MKLFDIDSPIIQWLTKIANLMMLNILTLILMIPVVTGGAALTAMQYVILKMVRDEDQYIFRSYFKSFKQNFRQATAIWLIFLLIFIILGGDFFILSHVENFPHSNVLTILIGMVAIIMACGFVFVFPVLAKFDNTVKKTVKNAFAISLLQLPKTALMIAMYLLPIIILYLNVEVFWRLIPIFLFFGMAAPAYVGALLYDKFFVSLEEKITENQNAEDGEADNAGEDDERIFHDEPMELPEEETK